MSAFVWTPENAKELDGFLKSPAGEKLIVLLKLATLVSGDTAPVSGVDANQIAAQSFAYHQGQASMFDLINSFKPKAVAQPLPPSFQPPKPK